MRIGAVCLVLALILQTSNAVAQPNSNEAMAVEFGHVGLRLFEKADWLGAFRAFEQAENQAHSVVFVVYMARCKRNSGQLLESRELYELAISDPSPAGRPPQWDAALEQARSELSELAGKIPSIRISVDVPDTQGIELWIDGKPISSVRIDQPIEMDPGTHVVAIRGAQGLGAVQSVTVLEGERERRVALKITRQSTRREATQTARRPAHEVSPRSHSGSRSSTPPVPALIAFGATGAAVVVGSVTGILALAETQKIRDRCTGTLCDASEKSRGDRAKALAAISTVSFVAAGVATIGGVALWVTLHKRNASPQLAEVAIGMRSHF